jgi:hypothetical protein
MHHKFNILAAYQNPCMTTTSFLSIETFAAAIIPKFMVLNIMPSDQKGRHCSLSLLLLP